MKRVDFEQVWRLEDYMQDMNVITDKFFNSIEEIAWIKSYGYTPVIFKYQDVNSELLHFIIRFNLPDDFVTLLYLKYPENTRRYDLPL